MDKYAVLDLIGEGSFGRVFRGKDKQTGEFVALKLIPKVGHSDKDIKSLRCECKIQKELKHPNIVKMIDAFETDNEVISVAEYVPGELFRLFDQYKSETVGERRLPEYRVKEIAGDLVSALHYLHTNRILHRDIKPQNILLDSQGRAKLCDFGFARNLGLNTMVLTSIKGTPLYMAPELIEEKPYDHTADIWSLGCIIYELLVGVPPFSTNSLFQLIKKIRYESVQWPGHLSAMSRAWLQGTLEKDARKRLSWPDLHQHPFIREHVSIQGEVPLVVTNLPPLTDTLTASQELAKEIQRQDKAKLLPGGSQTLIKVAQKHELQKQQLAHAQKTMFSRRQGLVSDKRRFSDGSHLQQQSPAGARGNGNGMLLGRHHASHMSRRMSEFGQQLSVMPHLAQAQYLAPVQPLHPAHHHLSHIQNNQHSQLPPQNHQILPQQVINQKPHSPIIAISQSLNPPPVQFTQSIQKTGLVQPEPMRGQHLEIGAVVEKLTALAVQEKEDANNESIDSNETLKNDEQRLLPEPEDTPLENDEWCEFLDGQLDEMLEELDNDGHIDCADNPNFLEMIIGPLRNKNTNPLVLLKIANILMLPLSSENQNSSTYKSLLNSYHDKHILQLLLLALTLSIENLDGGKEDKTEEEEAWALVTSLVSYLLHCDHMFEDQFPHLDSDTFLVLLSSENSEIILDAISILNKVVSKNLVNEEFLENIFNDICEELLLEETNDAILQKICIFLGLVAQNYKKCIKNTKATTSKLKQMSDSSSNPSIQHVVSFIVSALVI